LRSERDGKLRRVDPNAPAIVAVIFPPQHIAEIRFPSDPSDATTPPPPPIATALAAKSRLVFRLPDTSEGLPLTLDWLLDWTSWTPLLAPGALPAGQVLAPGVQSPAAPGAGETALEVPWRLLISPDATGAWHHDRIPRLLNSSNQVWRTHLQQTVAGNDGVVRQVDGGDVRVLAAVEGTGELLTSLSALHRSELVQLTSNYGIVLPDFDPPKIRAEANPR
jgi:hypothetical protein